MMKLLFRLFLATAATLAAANDNVCISDTYVYTTKVNLFAGELGYYTFEECPNQISPTIGMRLGQTYTFKQADRTNYYHPIGFSYYADGAHDAVDELEPGIAPPGSNSSCATTLTCPAPMYFRNGTYLGTYSNIPDVANVTTGKENFGLDDYEPLFFRPIPEWAGFGEFEVKLRFHEEVAQDLFYFCHIHQFMTGRIKLFKGFEFIQEGENLPEIPYAYDVPGPFDEECGTYGLDDYQLPHPECPDRFVCDIPAENVGLAQFSACIDAMNCHMLAGMTTNIEMGSPTALFIHQMVPHHQNAVNMAKALLKTDIVQCDDLTEESDGCILEGILREIINSQNYQILTMYRILESLGYNKTNDCKVTIKSQGGSGTDSTTSNANARLNVSSWVSIGLLIGAMLAFLLLCT